jgi:anthranilate synthase component 2
LHCAPKLAVGFRHLLIFDMFLLIDNYDSFTYNLWHYLSEIGVEVEVRRNDALSADDALALNPEAIIISPGPCDPDKAGICLELVEKAAGKMPIFGVCLGYQTIGQVFGAKVVRSPLPMHGKLSKISHVGTGIFVDLPENFEATRYHSLMLEPNNWPEDIEITAKTEDGVIMGIAHKEHAISGVQFHPESIASEHGHRLLQNFVNQVH